MKLRALDQISISAVQADSLRPGQVFEISDALASELLERHPSKFERLPEEKTENEPPNKAEPDPANKAAPKVRNKAAPKAAKSAGDHPPA